MQVLILPMCVKLNLEKRISLYYFFKVVYNLFKQYTLLKKLCIKYLKKTTTKRNQLLLIIFTFSVPNLRELIHFSTTSQCLPKPQYNYNKNPNHTNSKKDKT